MIGKILALVLCLRSMGARFRTDKGRRGDNRSINSTGRARYNRISGTTGSLDGSEEEFGRAC